MMKKNLNIVNIGNMHMILSSIIYIIIIELHWMERWDRTN